MPPGADLWPEVHSRAIFKALAFEGITIFLSIYRTLEGSRGHHLFCWKHEGGDVTQVDSYQSKAFGHQEVATTTHTPSLLVQTQPDF